MNVGLKPRPASSNREVLAGLIERVTFHNAANGFCVLHIKARGHHELVTVVGHAATISAGELDHCRRTGQRPHPRAAVQNPLPAQLGPHPRGKASRNISVPG